MAISAKKPLLLLCAILVAAPLSATADNPRRVTADAQSSAISSVDNSRAFLAYAASTPMVMTYVSNDGSISVCNQTGDATYIYEYSADLRPVKTMRFRNEHSTLGAFAKDGEGNYYLFYGKGVEENQRDVENMALVKYDRSGKRLKIYSLKAFADNSFHGIKLPFRSGACRMEISGNMLAVYFARQMFQSPKDGLNHQASYGFVINKDTFIRVDKGAATNATSQGNTQIPYVSHSFNQFILPVKNGFLFADHGDAYPRSFAFAKSLAGGATKRLEAFKFKEGKQHYNSTFAQMGGVAETPDGYIFAGTYEKNADASGEHNDARNVFVLTMDNGLDKISQPIWITNYRNKDRENAANPKIVALGSGRVLLMWELMGNAGYISTYVAIVDKAGKQLAAAKEIPGVRLSINDALRENPANGNVYWAVDNDDSNIDIYAFNPDKPIKPPARTGAPGGGHGLTLKSFTASKRAISQNEQLTATATIKNSTQAPFAGGQVGAALVDNGGNIVSVIGSDNFGALNPGSFRPNKAINCTVPGTVKPGQYRLRIVAKPEGREWRVATVTDSGVPNAIRISVTAGKRGARK